MTILKHYKDSKCKEKWHRETEGAAEALWTKGLPYVTLVHLLCQRHRQLTTHASKMCTTNRAEHTKRLCTVWTDQMYGAKNVVWNHTERGAPVTHMPPPSGLRATLFGIREIAGKGKNLPFY